MASSGTATAPPVGRPAGESTPTPAATGSVARHGARAIARRAYADGRIRTYSFAALFFLTCYANVVAYRSAYPNLADRLALARSLGTNDAVRLFYGEPYDLLTVGGYAAWRVGGVLTLLAAVWGLLAAIRATRAEEDAGRAELVLVGVVARRGVYLSALAAVAAGAALLWAAGAAGLVAAKLPVGASAYMALALVSVAAVYTGVGALAGQLAPSRRLATELASAALLISFLARVVADTTTTFEWLRWVTPLGWAEEMRPFTGARPWVLVLPLATSTVLLLAAGRLALRRDVGTGMLPARDSAPPNPHLLNSPLAQTLRGERASFIIWLASSCFFAFVVGAISTSIASAGLSGSLQRQVRQVAGVSIANPAGYMGLTFLFFVVVLALYACAQVGAARSAEMEQQLETLFALPVSRTGWLAGRLTLAAAGAAVIGLAAGVCAWAGAATQNAGVGLGQMLEAGANCLPVALLFLGLGALAYAVVPRASSAVAYGLVVVAFLWQLFATALSAPRWLVEVTPFQHVGLVPAQAFRAGDAAGMVAIGLAAGVAALWRFRRRDLIGP
jgi:ABC-2 type transport system permease protein